MMAQYLNVHFEVMRKVIYRFTVNKNCHLLDDNFVEDCMHIRHKAT